MPASQTVNSLLPQFPTYTILFLPQMPLRFPPPITTASTLQASMMATLHILPDSALGIAVSVLAIAVGLGAAKGRYRMKQRLNSSKGSTHSKSCPDAYQGEKGRHTGLANERAFNGSEADSHLQTTIAKLDHPIQLMTPPLTPPHPVRPFRALSPVPQTPLSCPTSNYLQVPISPDPTVLLSLTPTTAQNSDPPALAPSTPLSGIQSPNTRPNRADTTTLAPPSLPQLNTLPPNLDYTNTNYATLLNAQKLIAYERSRRAKLEADARAELGALLKVYWSGVKARCWDNRRRQRRRETFAIRSGGEAKVEAADDERELKEESDVKQKLALLQKRVLALREEKHPYEDVLYPSPPPTAYLLEGGKFTTTPSTRMAPSHLLSILSDPAIALKAEEVNVALGLWAGWDWDVEEEWGFEVQARRREESGSAAACQPEREVSSPALGLPMLRRLAISTQDVPLALFLKRVELASGLLEKVLIRVEDTASAFRAPRAVTTSNNPPHSSKGMKFSARRAGQSREGKRKEELRQSVVRCLEGMSEYISRNNATLALYLPDGVEDVWTSRGSKA